MVDYVITTIEILISLFLIWLIRTFPKSMGLICLGVAYWMRGMLLSNSSDGANIIGKKHMAAAIFAPGVGEHGVKVENIPVPGYTTSEILIKVNAAGLNPSNYKMNPAKLPFVRHARKGKHVIGYDVEGTVLAVGADKECHSFAVGNNIYGFGSGSIAEYAVVGCSRAGLSPKSLTSTQTAGLPVVALTSQEAWDRTLLSKDQSVLVIGASGGCGTFGVTLAKALGAHVTGICSTRNIDLVTNLGADAVVDYKKQSEMNKLIAKGQQFDVIYDTVTSFAPEDPDYEPAMRPLLKPGGKYVAINGSPMDWTRGIWEKILFSKLGIQIQRKDYDLFLLTPTTEKLNRLAKLIDEGIVPPTIIDTTYSLTEANLNAAFTFIKSRRVVGKICFEF